MVEDGFMEILAATIVSILHDLAPRYSPFAERDVVFAILFASELQAVVFGIDYRLAPEHPFPAAFDDSFQALEWVSTL